MPCIHSCVLICGSSAFFCRCCCCCYDSQPNMVEKTFYSIPLVFFSDNKKAVLHSTFYPFYTASHGSAKALYCKRKTRSQEKAFTWCSLLHVFHVAVAATAKWMAKSCSRSNWIRNWFVLQLKRKYEKLSDNERTIQSISWAKKNC